jgi:hypothetical protein
MVAQRGRGDKWCQYHIGKRERKRERGKGKREGKKKERIRV